MRLTTPILLYFFGSIIMFCNTAQSQCLSDTHDHNPLTSWLSCTPSPNPNPALESGHWIMLDLGQVYPLGAIQIWNYNVNGETDSGYDEIRIDFAITDNNWLLHSIQNLTEASGAYSYQGEQVTDLQGEAARYVLFSSISNHGGTCSGLSEIKISLPDNSACEDFSITTTSFAPSCPNVNNGSIQINPINGAPPIIYQWSNGATTSHIDGLISGSYSTTVTDQNGCKDGILITIDDPTDNESEYNSIPIPTDHYYNDNLIASKGLVAYNGDVAFSTLQSIQLEEEFEIVQGGIFTANIEDCILNEGTNTLMSSSASNYKNYDYIGLSHIDGITASASDEANRTKAHFAIGGQGIGADSLAVSRFLSQSTLGASVEMIAEAEQMGIADWLDWQFDIERQDFDSTFAEVIDAVYIDPGNGKIPFTYFRMAWWQNMLTGQDYLRDRIAFHLSQLFVVSNNSDLSVLGEGLSSYYDKLHSNALGNFRDILYDVTLQPSMGIYLSHLNNPKSDTSINQFPDENYAREVMQLFTIGLLELELDGALKKDIYGQEISTYDNDDVIEFSKIFTGLGFDAPMAEFGSRRYYDMTIPMIMYEDFHEPGPKFLLNNDTVQAGMTGLQDIDAALDNLFNHPNVGPFFCRRMIQYLVTSNPSPRYINSVVQAFEDNGAGIRGDMKAMIRAILLDSEARSCEKSADPKFGKLVEPLIRYTQLLRAFDVSSSDSTFYSSSLLFQELTFQAPLGAPSVFNFFSPNYVPSGLPSGVTIKGPEFQILNSYTSIGYYNIINAIKDNTSVLQHPRDAVIQLDLSDELLLATTPEALLDRLDLLFTYGNMSDDTRDVIANAMSQLNTDEDKLKIAFYLLLTSPDYVINR